MGRKPKSLAELELSGALKARPGRYAARIEAEKAAAQAPVETRFDEIVKPLSKPSPLGSAPKHLDADQKAIWKELTKTYPNLTFSDRFHLEIAVKLTHKLRTVEGGLKGQEYSQLLGILDRFSPVLGVVKNDKSDPEPIPAVITAPAEDTRTEYDKRWDEFVAEMDELDDPNSELSKQCDAASKKHVDEVCEWIEERRAKGLWTDNKHKEPEKAEYNLTPTPRPEPVEMDPARKQEQMERKWSM